ncbi:MAG: hypothetical protein KZQ72_11175, partial [Candidatus Thiodiazotropha sp. (ex Cardiolucina cf. quadrata)]|nr:hypothetical protein [Candidatus Thiodiazotropha sp. (ex Cardiolucina cf. quadrata)]
RKARRVYSLASRLPGTNRLGFQPSMALSEGNKKLKEVTHEKVDQNCHLFDDISDSESTVCQYPAH